MTEENNLTIEDLQRSVLELTNQNKELSEKVTTLSSKTSETEEDLKKARDLNAKLIINSNAGMYEDNITNPEPSDSFEAIMDDCIKASKDKLLNRYKGEN